MVVHFTVLTSCYIILENDDCGTMISRIVARATLPQPKGFFLHPFIELEIIALVNPVDLDPSKEEVIFWKCDLTSTKKTLSINVPLINHGLNTALLDLIKSEMSDKERERRRLTNTLDSESLLMKYLPQQYINGERKFKVQSSSQGTWGRQD